MLKWRDFSPTSYKEYTWDEQYSDFCAGNLFSTFSWGDTTPFLEDREGLPQGCRQSGLFPASGHAQDRRRRPGLDHSEKGAQRRSRLSVPAAPRVQGSAVGLSGDRLCDLSHRCSGHERLGRRRPFPHAPQADRGRTSLCAAQPAGPACHPGNHDGGAERGRRRSAGRARPPSPIWSSVPERWSAETDSQGAAS